MNSREQFLTAVSQAGLGHVFSSEDAILIRTTAATNDHVQRFLEWELQGQDAVTVATVRRSLEMQDNRPIVIGRDSAERVRALLSQSNLPTTISEAGQHAYIVRDGETVIDVYGSLAAHGGMLAPEAVTKDEWIREGVAAIDRHVITIDAELALRKIEQDVAHAHRAPAAENALVL